MTNFSNQSLSNRSFAGENLAGANFRNADIRGCDFTNANLEGADFSGVRTGKSLRQQVILISCVITETLISIAVAIFAFGVLATFIFEKIFANVTTFNGLFAGCVAFGSGVLLCFLYLLFRLITKTHHKDLPMGQSIVAVFVGVIIILGKMGFGEFIKGNIFGGIFYFSLAIFCSWLTWFGIVLAVRTFQRATGTSFTKANLSYAQFIQSTLTGCDFSNSDISNAKFYKANLRNSVLTNINADGTDFSGAIFKGAYIQNCRINDNTKFDDVIWSRKAKTGWLDFSNQDLRNYSFKDDQNLVGANFRNADIRGCDFTNANLEGANFSGVKAGRSRTQEIILMAVVFGILIQGVFASAVAFKFVNASLIEFAGAVVGSLIFSLGITFTFLFIFSLAPIFDNVLSVLLFSPVMYVAMDGFAFASIATFNEFTKGSFLWGIFIAVIALFLALVLYFIFYGIILEFQKILGTSFSKTNLLDAQFSQSILSNCDFSNSDLTNATFHRAKLQNVNLANAKAHGTDFSRAKFKNINIQNWSIDADTNFNDAILSQELITTLLDSSNQHPINVQDGETDTVSNVNPLDFSNQDLRNRSFKDNQNLAGANFRNADIRGCDFTNANLEGADFSGTKAGRSRTQEITFIVAVLIGVVQGFLGSKVLTFSYDFGGYILSIPIMILGLLIGLFVSHSLITFLRSLSESLNKEFVNDTLLMSFCSGFILGLHLILAPFCLFLLWMLIGDFELKTGTFLNKANLSRTQFIEATLINCDFSSSDLNNATFYKATLRNSNFANANANGTDFSSAKLIGTNKKNWNINADTNFNETIFIENISTIWLGFLVNFFKKANLLGLFLMGFSFACYIPLIVPFVNSNILLFLKLIIVVWLIFSILISPLFSRFSDKDITKLRKKLRIPFIGLIFTTYIIYIIYRICILFGGEHEHIGGTGSISFSSAGSLLGDIFWLPILSLALVIRKIRRNGRNLFISIIFTVSSFAFGIGVGYLIFVTLPNLILLGWITMPIGLLFLISSFPFEDS
ncbi:MAG: pentapeptide repeat-containing protein [Microcystis sp.]|uniref:pentapeptide repeat-containing protein n=2 Tax=unclassified Microcystis TaxID=2643300 RepID=UPI00391B6F06